MDPKNQRRVVLYVRVRKGKYPRILLVLIGRVDVWQYAVWKHPVVPCGCQQVGAAEMRYTGTAGIRVTVERCGVP